MNAPIIIFTYNRIENLKKLILSLKKNPEYKNSKIYVFIDGPKNQKVIVWNLEKLLTLDALRYSCNQIRDYLHNSTEVKPSDRHLCDL